MKNKKKTISEVGFKCQLKHEKNTLIPLSKKSPLKPKQSSKPSCQSSLQSSNLNLKNRKQENAFYGKKYHYGQINSKKVYQSNQSSTHCSFNNKSIKQKSHENKKTCKSKSLKMARNIGKQIDQLEETEIYLNEQQILELINNYATKIQKQWRRYWLRKCLRFIVFKQRERKLFLRKNYSYSHQICYQPFTQALRQQSVPSLFKNDEEKRHPLPKLFDLKKKNCQINPLQLKEKPILKAQISFNSEPLTQQFFNNQKYTSLSSFQSGKFLSTHDLALKNLTKQKQIEPHKRTCSLQEKLELQLKNQHQAPETVDLGFNVLSDQFFDQQKNLIHSVNASMSGQHDTIFNSDKKSSEKNSNIKLQLKVYQYHIYEDNEKRKNKKFEDYHQKQVYEKNLFQKQKIVEERPHSNAEQSTIKSKYDTKFPISSLQKDPFGIINIFKKCKNAIEQKGNKKISKLSKHYEQRQITERTYKNMLKQARQKLNNEINTIQIKEGHFQNSWKEVYAMFKDYLKQNSFNQTTDIHQDFDDQHSISFERWDFQSSAKKSISHLESFQDFARQLNERNPDKLKGPFIYHKKVNSEHKSIEKVLVQLDLFENQLNFKENCEQTEQVGSILEELRKQQGLNSFQKKNQHILISKGAENLGHDQRKNLPFSTEIASYSLPKLNATSGKNISKFTQDKNQLQFSEKIGQLSAKQQEIQTFLNTPIKQKQNCQSNDTRKKYLYSDEKIKNAKRAKNQQIDDSSQSSDVEIKITSININREQNNLLKQVGELEKCQEKTQWKNQSQPGSNHFSASELDQTRQKESKDHKLKNSFSSFQIQSQVINQQTCKQEIQNQIEFFPIDKVTKKKIQQSIKFIQILADNLYVNKFLPKRPVFINSIINALKDIHRNRLRKREMIENQFRKYPKTIDPTIDAINTWLLEISHHLLDHHNLEIKKNLLSVRQIPQQQMLSICHSQSQSNSFYQSHSYVTISQKIFKEFEFFYLKNLVSNLQIQEIHQQNFEHLLYAFHRCLIDCMNLTLLDELSVGKNWVKIPWINTFRLKKNEVYEHAKQCLERAINKVSGWGQYCLAQLTQNNDVSQGQWKQYQEQKMNLVIREQILEYSFENQFIQSNILFKICQQIYLSQMQKAAFQILTI